MQRILSYLTSKRTFFFFIFKYNTTKNEDYSLDLKNFYIILFSYNSLEICDKIVQLLLKILTITCQFYNEQERVFHKENKIETKSYSEMI